MLKPNIEGWSIVIAGHWNRRIFTPAWIGNGRLTNLAEIGMEIPVDNPTLPVKFHFDGVELTVRTVRLEIRPERAEDELIAKCAQIGARILAELSHTPIQGVGFNFRFDMEPVEGPLLGLFTLSDKNSLSDAGYAITSTTITRAIALGGQAINLTTSEENGKSAISFNFHFSPTNTQAAREFIEAHGVDFRVKAFEILQQIYQIAPENEEVAK